MIPKIFLVISVTLTFPAKAPAASNPAYYHLGTGKTLAGNELRDTDYYVSIFAAQWPTVKNECSGIGGNLLAIESPEEQALIDKWLESQTGEIFWTGGWYNSGIWVWSPDTPVMFANWNPDQVGLVPSYFHRLSMFYDRDAKKSNWKQQFSSNTYRNICEVRQ